MLTGFARSAFLATVMGMLCMTASAGATVIARDVTFDLDNLNLHLAGSLPGPSFMTADTPIAPAVLQPGDTLVLNISFLGGVGLRFARVDGVREFFYFGADSDANVDVWPSTRTLWSFTGVEGELLQNDLLQSGTMTSAGFVTGVNQFSTFLTNSSFTFTGLTLTTEIQGMVTDPMVVDTIRFGGGDGDFSVVAAPAGDSAIPEPASLGLLAWGLLCLAAGARRARA